MVLTRSKRSVRQKARIEDDTDTAGGSKGYIEDTEHTSQEIASTDTPKDDLDLLTEKVFAKLKQEKELDKKTSSPDVLQLDSNSGDPSTELASSLQPDVGETPYFSQESYSQLKGPSSSGFRQSEIDSLLKKTVITADFETRDSVPPIEGPSKQARRKANEAARQRSAGKGWFDMPAPQLTPELKNDLKLLRMRNALDPSRHYKANDSKQLPRYFQVGRVVSGVGEFYSSRIPRKQQKQTLVEELLANEEARSYHKKKYLELQAKFSSGTKRLRHIKHKKKFRK